ncbi:siderophore ABC transporter substrate-binding protein [Fulvimarina endophytica]|uniref:Siderophore ABC transporter substrate-binding protein n=1 Tax=Fulvimarina endophytica TaxID=2293836 RepID=A0A371XA70_9HYPH|nr:siderophore ABC transporter substrate-binding protein [Fulvimarina endophytica]RFC66133.1 siderophore ABC transporter substrate-binding protein [Fulvimarina endophytica]
MPTIFRRRTIFSSALSLALSATILSWTGILPTLAQDGSTITVATDQGEKSVPANPETIAVYDLAAIDTLDALGVEIDGVPTAVYPNYLEKFAGADYAKVGTLFEPDFEAVNALQPDLVVVGGRSRTQSEALSQIAPTIDMSVDNEDFLQNAFDRAHALGSIFDKADEADAKIAALKSSIEDLKAKAAGAGKGLILLTTGNRVSAFGPGSRFGVLHSGYGIEPADTGLDTGNHGEAVSFEYIAKIDPDWIFVIDRDAAIGRGSAASLLDNELVHGTKAWRNDRVVYLDPALWYLAASGLQSMQASVDQISEALSKNGS